MERMCTNTHASWLMCLLEPFKELGLDSQRDKKLALKLDAHSVK